MTNESNPLILTPQGNVHVLDAKVTLDGNSQFRHEDYGQYDQTQTRDERETAAHAKGLQYVGLDGSVGVIANGAGLAMSTVDVINQVGGQPANFLDIGGGANADVMAGALEVINNDPNVKAIFINIFGGITRGEEVANGIIEAMKRVDISSPIVIRLDGTNADEGRAILEPNLSEGGRLDLPIQLHPILQNFLQTFFNLNYIFFFPIISCFFKLPKSFFFITSSTTITIACRWISFTNAYAR